MKKNLLFACLLLSAPFIFSAKRNRRLSDPTPLEAHEFVDGGQVIKYQTPALKESGLYFVARKCSACGTYRIGRECGHMPPRVIDPR